MCVCMCLYVSVCVCVCAAKMKGCELEMLRFADKNGLPEEAITGMAAFGEYVRKGWRCAWWEGGRGGGGCVVYKGATFAF